MFRFPLFAVLFLSPLVLSDKSSAADRVLRGISDWEAESAQAEHSADGRIRMAVRDWLAATVDTEVTNTDVLRLLDEPSVTRQVHVERRERPYGDMWRATVEVTIPRRATTAWNAVRSAESFGRRLVLLLRVTLTLITGIATSVGARHWDRQTCGYARRLICLVVAPLAFTVIATIWLVG